MWLVRRFRRRRRWSGAGSDGDRVLARTFSAEMLDEVVDAAECAEAALSAGCQRA